MREQNKNTGFIRQPWITNSIKKWGELIEVGAFNIASVNSILNENLSLWEENTSRQTAFRVHKDTKNIILYWSEDNIDHINGEIQVHKENCILFEDVIADVKNALQIIFSFKNMKIYKMTLVGLPSGGIILPHIDTAIPLRCVHRIHIPVVTHPDIKVCIANKEFHLEAGKIYNFNNTLLHSVKNPSDIMRIHIIVDVQDEDIYVERMNQIISYIPQQAKAKMKQKKGSGTTVIDDIYRG